MDVVLFFAEIAIAHEHSIRAAVVRPTDDRPVPIHQYSSFTASDRYRHRKHRSVYVLYCSSDPCPAAGHLKMLHPKNNENSVLNSNK